MIVTDERVARFVGERIGESIYPPFTCIGIERDSAIVAGAVFNCFTGPDVQVSVAIEGPITRAFVRACGRYVFVQLGCERATFITEHPHVINLAERLNAQTEGRLRNHFGPGRDGIILGLLKEDWKL